VCRQLGALGFPTCAPEQVSPGMPVVGVVALASYNPRSQLLRRAVRAARQLERPIRFCHVAGERPVLPPAAAWFSEID
jgi:hypothetical protein